MIDHLRLICYYIFTNMLMIRLQRVGRRNDPQFRVVVTDSQNGPKSGKFIDIVGSHNPQTKQTELKTDVIKEWISKGAQPSDTIHNLLITKGVISGKKINVLPQKSPPKKEDKGDTLPIAETPPVEKKGEDTPAEDGSPKESEATPAQEDKAAV